MCVRVRLVLQCSSRSITPQSQHFQSQDSQSVKTHSSNHETTNNWLKYVLNLLLFWCVLFHFISLERENKRSTTYKAKQGRCIDKCNPKHFKNECSGVGMAFTAKSHRTWWLDEQYPALVKQCFLPGLRKIPLHLLANNLCATMATSCLPNHTSECPEEILWDCLPKTSCWLTSWQRSVLVFPEMKDGSV